jgi:hypothetical protein
MPEMYNIYCDESCHLLNDQSSVMVLGAVWCPATAAREFSEKVKQVKIEHGLKPGAEVKWHKVSPANLAFHLALVDLFFADDRLRFRGVIVPDKSVLRHEVFKQTHDDWYYKMYFVLLETILDPKTPFCVYLDYKDTHGGSKVRKLEEVLRNSKYDFSGQIVERVQIVRSHESALIQMADLLIGAVAYANRGLNQSAAKLTLVDDIKRRSGHTLTKTTWLRELKFNLLVWQHKGEPECR